MRTTIGVLLLGLGTATLQAQDKIDVKVLKVREIRVAYFDKDLEEADSESFSNLDPRPGMELLLAIEGRTMSDASSYGKLKIEKAADDTGTDLKEPKKKKSTFFFGSDNTDDFKRIEEEGSHFADATKAEKGFRLTLPLGLPARKASAIKTLEGSLVVLSGGEKKSVTRKSIRSLYGKTIDDPALHAAKLEVKVVDPKNRKGPFGQSAEEQGKSVTLEVTGDLNALDEVLVLDKAGEDVTLSRMWSTSGDTQTTTYDLDKKLTDDMTLTISIFVGLKQIDVPIKLANIQLP